MIEALLADGADESFGVRVRTRRTDRSADGLDTDRGEHLVEAGGELGVAVADEESEHPTGILQVRGEIAGHLCDPWAVRVGGGSEDVRDAALHFDDEQHVVAPQEDSVDVEEVRGHNALGLGGEELGPRWALSPGFSRNKTGQEGDEGTVGPGEAETGDLPVQHGQLVAEYEDLSVLGRGIHPMNANDLHDAPDETVEEGQGEERQASPSVSWLVKLGQGVSCLL